MSRRHRHQEWLRFLRRLDGEFPPQIELHLVMDNYGTHKEPQVQAWLKKHPRFVSHFIPTAHLVVLSMSERVTVQGKISRSATTKPLDERIDQYQSIG